MTIAQNHVLTPLLQFTVIYYLLENKMLNFKYITSSSSFFFFFSVHSVDSYDL